MNVQYKCADSQVFMHMKEVFFFFIQTECVGEIHLRKEENNLNMHFMLFYWTHTCAHMYKV